MSLTTPYGPPNRPPCGGFGARKAVSSCFNHERKDEKHLPIFENKTRIGACGPTDTPVSGTSDADCVDESGGDHGPACACAGGEVLLEGNCYHATGTFADVSLCHKRGSKRVMAKKAIHGAQPFYLDASVAPCDGCDRGKRYLTFQLVAVDVVEQVYDGGVVYHGETHVSWQFSVNRYTGVITLDSCSFVPSGDQGVDTPTTVADCQANGSDAYAQTVGCFDDATITAKNFTTDSSMGYFVDTYNQDFSAGDGHVHFHSVQVGGYTGPDHSQITTTTRTYDAYLTNGVDVASYVSDCVDLLDNFPLDDDTVYPWVDGWADCTRMPMLSYLEAGPQSPIIEATYLCDYVFPDAAVYTGAVIGAPLPSAGYGPHFDFGMGIRNPTPVAASTAWNSVSESCLVPDGAFIITNSGHVYVGKYAEIQDMFHSHNFFRPCGADRDMLNETCALCWDGRDVDHPLAWAICGRSVLNTAVISGGGTTYTCVTPVPYLRVGDMVDIVGIGLSNVAVTAIVDDTHFTIAGSHPLTGGSEYYVISHGAPDWKWNDNHPKGDFRWQEYTHDACAETVAATCENDCIARKACYPSVMCYSPNGETFPNGKVKWFGTPVYKNGIYVVGIPTSEVPDPIDSACGNADGTLGGESCTNTDPQSVEARCDLPTIGEDTAPALPGGINWGCPDGPGCAEPDPRSCRGSEDNEEPM